MVKAKKCTFSWLFCSYLFCACIFSIFQQIWNEHKSVRFWYHSHRRTEPKNTQRKVCAAPTNELIHVPLVGSMHQSLCVPILPTESGYFRGKREPLKKDLRTGDSLCQSYPFKRLPLFTWSRWKQKYIDYEMAAKLWIKGVSSATVPHQYWQHGCRSTGTTSKCYSSTTLIF